MVQTQRQAMNSNNASSFEIASLLYHSVCFLKLSTAPEDAPFCAETPEDAGLEASKPSLAHQEARSDALPLEQWTAGHQQEMI